MSTSPDPDSDQPEPQPITTPATEQPDAVQPDAVEQSAQVASSDVGPDLEEPGAATAEGIAATEPVADAIEATELPSPPIDSPRRCLDCGSELDGPYCSACGQRDIDRIVPLGDLVGDLLDELTGLQARLWRTLRQLVTRPGFLTAEYVGGRRIHYVAPVRLYLLIALGFFFLVTSFDPIDAETSAEMIASEVFATYVRESGLPREMFIRKFLEK